MCCEGEGYTNAYSTMGPRAYHRRAWVGALLSSIRSQVQHPLACDVPQAAGLATTGRKLIA